MTNLAFVVMGGMSEYFNLRVDKSLKLSGNNSQVEPDGTLGGVGMLDESKIRQVKRVPGVSDAYGMLLIQLDPEEGGFFRDMIFGVPIEQQLKDAKLTSGRYLVPGDVYKAVLGSSIARKYDQVGQNW